MVPENIETMIPETIPAPVGFLVKSRFLMVRRRKIPRFEEICDCLVPVYDWKEAPPYIFVSHRWLSHDLLDNELHTQSLVLQRFARRETAADHYWVDCACLPREPGARVALAATFAELVRRAALYLVLPFAPTPLSMVPVYDPEAYAQRGWCALEAALYLRRPRAVRLARLAHRDGRLGLRFARLPSARRGDGAHHLLAAVTRLRDLLLRGRAEAFLQAFEFSRPAEDGPLVWGLLHAPAAGGGGGGPPGAGGPSVGEGLVAAPPDAGLVCCYRPAPLPGPRRGSLEEVAAVASLTGSLEEAATPALPTEVLEDVDELPSPSDAPGEGVASAEAGGPVAGSAARAGNPGPLGVPAVPHKRPVVRPTARGVRGSSFASTQTETSRNGSAVEEVTEGDGGDEEECGGGGDEEDSLSAHTAEGRPLAADDHNKASTVKVQEAGGSGSSSLLPPSFEVPIAPSSLPPSLPKPARGGKADPVIYELLYKTVSIRRQSWGPNAHFTTALPDDGDGNVLLGRRQSPWGASQDGCSRAGECLAM